jgi:hypothetical protein
MPTTILTAAIWSVDTLTKEWMAKARNVRVYQLNQALNQFSIFRSQRKNFASSFDEKVRAVFVAPEYYFARQSDDHTLGYDDVSAKELGRQISQQRNALIVPGTVASRKPVTETRREKYLAGIGELGDEVPDYYAKRAAMEGKTWFVRNTAYGFLHGKKELKCRKQRDATDGTTDEGKEVFVPGWKTNKKRFKVDPDDRELSFGIEICADASNERSGTMGYVDTTDDSPVDVKIVVSAFLEKKVVYAEKFNYALIHAASNGDHSGVTVTGDAAMKCHQTWKFLGHKLELYTITIN